MAEHATQAIIGWGSQLARGNGDGDPSTGAGETFTPVTEVTEFTPPEESADDVEVTHFESPNKRKEYIRGMINSGEASCKINYNPSVYPSHRALADDFESGDLNWYRFTLPESMETITFRGYVKGFKRNIAPSDALTADVTFKAMATSFERTT